VPQQKSDTATAMISDDPDQYDTIYMTDRRRTFIDSATSEILLMEWSTREDGWVPALQTLTEWQKGNLRVYSPVDGSADWPYLVTMPGGGEWPYLLEHEEAEVKAILSKPWIPQGQITVIREEEIGLMEIYQEANRNGESIMAEASTIAYLDSLLRPALLIEMIPEFVDPDTRTTTRPTTTAAVARATTRATTAAVARATTAAATRAPTPQRQTINPFPSHLVAAILSHAVATSAVCPITMDAITTTNATITSCGHIFQTVAIRHWLTNHDTCPECRAPVAV